jgi:hypothetical protein
VRRYLFDQSSLRDGHQGLGVPRLSVLALAALHTKLAHELAAKMPAHLQYQQRQVRVVCVCARGGQQRAVQ